MGVKHGLGIAAGLGTGIAIAGCLAMSVAATAAPAGKAKSSSGTVAYLLTDIRPAMYETADGKEECPLGFNVGNMEQYKAQFPTEEAQKAQRAKYGSFSNRGRNGENVNFVPDSVVDPLPYRDAGAKFGYGLNLDGKVGPHDFVSPEGETGVDNQMYRVLGCIEGWRKLGIMDMQTQRYLRRNSFNRVIFVISGVTDLKNSDHVVVRTYRGLGGVDDMMFDSKDRGVPGTTQQIDFKYGKRFIHEFKGKIVDGVLTTEPADYVMPWSIIGTAGFTGDERWLRDSRLRLKVTADGAEGLLAGYQDVDTWWKAYAKRSSGGFGEFIKGSPPSIWAALYRLADAYPDPKTGKNTAISMAEAVQFSRAEVSNLPNEVAMSPAASDRISK